MTVEDRRTVEAEREPNFLLAQAEKRVLRAIEAQALGRFSIGYGLIGPTEIRMILIGLNTALALAPGGVHVTLGHTRFTPLDLVGMAIAGVMVVLLLARVVRNLRELAALEPAASRRGPSTQP